MKSTLKNAACFKLLIFAIVLLSASFAYSQQSFWCKTFAPGHNFRHTFGWQDSVTHLCAIRLDPREYNFDIIRARVSTMWIDAELNDNGQYGDPRVSDSIWWHWEEVNLYGFGITTINLSILTGDSIPYSAITSGTYGPDTLEIPTEMHPQEGEVIQADTVIFSWNPVDSAYAYNFYLWDRQPDLVNFTDGLCYVVEDFRNTEIAAPLQEIGVSGDYYWLLMALNQTMWTAGSAEIGSFSFEARSVNSTEIPQQASITQLFPNPANSSATVQFVSPLDKSRQMSLLDLNGRQVYQALVPAGVTFHSLDISSYPSGSYILLMGDGRVEQSQRLNVVK